MNALRPQKILTNYDFVDVIDEKIEELVSVLLHVIIKIHFFFAQSSNEFFGCDGSNFFLLSGNRIKQVCQAR